MGRPRKHNNDLPVGIYYRHGAFYHVAKGVWKRIGTTPDEMRRYSAALPRSKPDYKNEVLAACDQCFARAKQNARVRKGGIPFDISRDDIIRLLEAANWRCAVTGVLFSTEKISGRAPFAPSIDRVDSAKGYTPDNCRVVCVAANYAMNIWGDDVLWRLFKKKRAEYWTVSNSPKKKNLQFIEC